jgi:hypothetical protein
MKNGGTRGEAGGDKALMARELDKSKFKSPILTNL